MFVLMFHKTKQKTLGRSHVTLLLLIRKSAHTQSECNILPIVENLRIHGLQEHKPFYSGDWAVCNGNANFHECFPKSPLLWWSTW